MSKGGIEVATHFSNDYFQTDPNFTVVRPDWGQLHKAVEVIEETVFGQDKAAMAVAGAVMRVKAGFNAPGRPEFVGIFLGTPGCGKTEMGRAIAKLYYPDEWENHLKIVSLANFHSEHSVSRLVGAPTGYVGWGAPDSMVFDRQFLSRRNVVVFDEVEKAHPQVHKVLLRVLEEGRLEVQIGAKAYENVRNTDLDFSQSTIIFTSNIGSHEIQQARSGRARLGFNSSVEEEDIGTVGLRALRERFAHMPEFIDRIPESHRIVFDLLTPAVFARIFDKFMAQYGSDGIIVTSELRDWIVDRLDPAQGARQLRSKIEDLILTPAALVIARQGKRIPLVAGVDLEEGNGRVWFRANRMFLESDHKPSTAIIPFKIGGHELIPIPTI